MYSRHQTFRLRQGSEFVLCTVFLYFTYSISSQSFFFFNKSYVLFIDFLKIIFQAQFPFLLPLPNEVCSNTNVLSYTDNIVFAVIYASVLLLMRNIIYFSWMLKWHVLGDYILIYSWFKKFFSIELGACIFQNIESIVDHIIFPTRNMKFFEVLKIIN